MAAAAAAAQPTIQIDEYTFTLQYGFIRGDRPTVFFISSRPGEEAQQFLTYKSNSEGCWRLGIISADGYYKGQIDYVTQSFLHLDLQNLLNTTFATLPPPPEDHFKTYEASRNPAIKTAFNNANYTNSIHTDRQVVDPVFRVLKNATEDKFQPFGRSRPEFFARPDPLYDFFMKRQPLPPLPGLANSPPSSPFSRRLPEKLKKRINELNAEPHIDEVNDELFQMVRAAKGANGKRPIDTAETMRIFGRLVQEHFTIIGPQTPLFNTELSFFTDSAKTVRSTTVLHLFSVPVRNNMTDVVYNFIIAYYTYEGRPYKHLMNIIPSTATVLANGLYSKYVSAGGYIYKPFDYYMQCHTVSGVRSCNESDYAFIGEIFQDMWPLTELEMPAAGGGAAAGGRRKRSRRSKTKRSRKGIRPTRNRRH